jgi:phosphoribosylanthranilate isomerase
VTKVKICGVTRLEDARFCAAAGADFLGFIQHTGSARFVEPALVKEILAWVSGPTPVGVFVDETAQAVNARCADVGFQMAQLHGSETPETCAAVTVPVVKAIRVTHDASAEQVLALAAPYLGVVDALLLDTHHTSLFGGTGESFNWRVARALTAEADVFLAGGISAANVAEAIHTMRPYAVDLSSSVEESPGVKDLDRLADFFDAFRAATAT